MVNSMVRLASLSVLLLAALALPPSASAKEPGIHNPEVPTPVTMYMHLINVQDFPINTQQPDDSWTQDTTYGLGTSTLSCTPEDPTGTTNVRAPFHTFYGYSSPSYVEYLQEESGQPRVHPERGISYDTRLDPATPFVLYFYASVVGPANVDGDVDPDMVPLPVPNVVVEATMRTGDAVSVNDRAYNSGEVIAQGGTQPATLFMDQVLPGTGGPPAETTALGQHDGKWLYEFAIPMAIEIPVIPRATGYNLRIDLYMDGPACPNAPDEALMPNVLAIHTSPAFRPRMELALLNPIRISALHPQFVGDDLVIHAAANAALGNYDLAEPSPYTPDVGTQGFTIGVEGPSAATSLALANLVSHTNPHYMHQEDVTLAYLWPYKADRAEPGVYTVTLKVTNDQQNAEAIAVSQFEIGKNVATECDEKGCRPTTPVDPPEGRGAPGLGLLAALAVLALAAVAVRRRGGGDS